MADAGELPAGVAGRPRGAWTTLAALTRFRTCFAGAALCVVGSRLANSPVPGAEVALAGTSIALLIAFAQTVNDVADRELDRLAKPSRPLPSGAASLSLAIWTAVVCAAGGLLAAAVADPRLVPFALVLLALSWLYSYRLKDTVLAGNLLVALLASSCVPYGALPGGVSEEAILVQVVVVVFSLALEVLKTAIDSRGDALGGLTTVATRHGVRATALLAAGLCAAAGTAAAALMPLATHPLRYAIVVVVAVVLPTYACAARLLVRGHEEDALKRSMLLLRIAWGGGILSLLLL